MANNKIILKKSSVSARVPAVDDLDYGELALNYNDGYLYYKDSSNTIQSFAAGSAADINFTDATNSTFTTAPVTFSGGILVEKDIHTNGNVNLADDKVLTVGQGSGTSGSYVKLYNTEGDPTLEMSSKFSKAIHFGQPEDSAEVRGPTNLSGYAFTDSNGVFTSETIDSVDGVFFDADSSTQGTFSQVTLSTGGTGQSTTGGFLNPTGYSSHFRFERSSAERTLTTASFDARDYGQLSFFLIAGNSQNGGERTDTGDDFVISYSNDGGSTFTELVRVTGSVADTTYPDWTSLALELDDVVTNSTGNDVIKFQNFYTTSGDFDHYGLAAVSISPAQNLLRFRSTNDDGFTVLTLSETASQFNTRVIVQGPVQNNNTTTLVGATETSSLTVNGFFDANGNVALGNSTSNVIDINGDLDVNHTSTFSGLATFNSQLTANGNVTLGNQVGDTISVNGTLNVIQGANFQADVQIGNSSLDDLDVIATTDFRSGVTLGSSSLNAINVNGTFTSNNTSTFNDLTTITDTLAISSAGSLNFATGATLSGQINATGSLVIGGNDAASERVDFIYTDDLVASWIGINDGSFAQMDEISSAAYNSGTNRYEITLTANHKLKQNDHIYFSGTGTSLDGTHMGPMLVGSETMVYITGGVTLPTLSSGYVRRSAYIVNPRIRDADIFDSNFSGTFSGSLGGDLLTNGYDIELTNNDRLVWNSAGTGGNGTFIEGFGSTTLANSFLQFNLQSGSGVSTSKFRIEGTGAVLPTTTYLTFDQGTYSGTVNFETLTSNKTITLPDATGTVALTSDIAGNINNIVEDTNPQLGGHLDGNGFDVRLDSDDSIAWGFGELGVSYTSIRGRGDANDDAILEFYIQAGSSLSSKPFEIDVSGPRVQRTRYLKLGVDSEVDSFYTALFAREPTAGNIIYVPDAFGTMAVSVSDTTTTTQGDLNVDFTLSVAGDISATGDAHGLGTADSPTFDNLTITNDLVLNGDRHSIGISSASNLNEGGAGNRWDAAFTNNVLHLHHPSTGNVGAGLKFTRFGNTAGIDIGINNYDNFFIQNNATAGGIAFTTQDTERVFISSSGVDFSSPVNFNNTTSSTSTTTGAVIVDGGVGIAENLNVGGTTTLAGNITSTATHMYVPATFTIDPATHGDATGTVVIAGDLTVQGNTVTVSSNEVNIGDAILVLNSDEAGVPSQDSGIEIERGTSTNVSLLWDEANDKWSIGSETFAAGTFEGSLTGNVTGNVTGTVSDISNHDTGDLSEGTNLYYTQGRFDTAFTAKSTTDLSEGTNLYYTTDRANTDFDSRLGTKSTTDLSEGTNLYYTDDRARTSISITDAGGDGSLSYDNTSGVITYTGPSAAEVRAHFSQSTGVTITDGAISIGQSVGTTDDVTFNSVAANLTGNVTGTVSDISNHDTGDLSEGTNLYYTDDRVNTAIDTRVNKAFVDALDVDADTLDGIDSTGFATAAQGTKADTAYQPSDNVIFYNGYALETYVVTVASKTADHPNQTGSANAFYLNGNEAPFIHLQPNRSYRFDQSDASNDTHPLKFYAKENKFGGQYTTGVTTNGTPGQAGAYTEIAVGFDTPPTLYYQCEAHDYMGGGAFAPTDGFNSVDTDDVSEGSTNLYFTNARAQSAITKTVIDALNVDAATLNGQNPSYYLDYGNLTNIPQGVDVSDVSDLTDDFNLLFSGSYTDLTNKPTSFSALTSLSMVTGVSVDEFSNDVQLGTTAPSQTALITEYAVKTYLDTNMPTGLLDLGITDGSDGQVLITDGAGNFSFSSVSSSGGGLGNVVEDTTPQLGGNLDVNGQTITSASNGDVAIAPNGTGNLVLNGLNFPTSDGTSGQVIRTDGAGNLTFGTVSGGGGAGDVVPKHGIEVYEGDGTTTIFTLNNSVTNENQLWIEVGGVTQTPGSSYSYTASGTTLTFNEAPNEDDRIVVRYLIYTFA